MRSAGDDLDLLKEAPDADGMGERFVQHLHRNFPVVLEILGAVLRGHPAFADAAVNAVAVSDGALKTVAAGS